jgi:hypothetical protein
MNDGEKNAAEEEFARELASAMEAFLKDRMAEGFTREEAAELAKRRVTEVFASERRKGFKILNKR